MTEEGKLRKLVGDFAVSSLASGSGRDLIEILIIVERDRGVQPAKEGSAARNS